MHHLFIVSAPIEREIEFTMHQTTRKHINIVIDDDIYGLALFKRKSTQTYCPAVSRRDHDN
jgi:hypothetical protein